MGTMEDMGEDSGGNYVFKVKFINGHDFGDGRIDFNAEFEQTGNEPVLGREVVLAEAPVPNLATVTTSKCCGKEVKVPMNAKTTTMEKWFDAKQSAKTEVIQNQDMSPNATKIKLDMNLTHSQGSGLSEINNEGKRESTVLAND